MNTIIKYFGIFSLVILTACSKGDSSGGGTQPPTIPVPVAATLGAPTNNTACLDGVSINTTDATVSLTWQAAVNAESYDVVVKNLNSLVINTYNSTLTSKDVILTKGEPYSWYVVSKSSKTTTTAQSDKWKFYLAGNASSSYAPFPATVIAPIANAIIISNGVATVTVTLQWDTSDVDNDIVSYAIYLDDKDASTKIIPSVSTKNTTWSLASGKKYYWRIITTDKVGNSSNSEVFSFAIQ